MPPFNSGPNKFSEMQGEVWAYETSSPGYIRSLEASPGTLSYSPEPLHDPAGTDPKARVSARAVAILDRPGLWHFRAAITGSSAVKENYRFVPCDPAIVQVLLMLEGLVSQDVNVRQWGGAAVAAAVAISANGDEAGLAPHVRAVAYGQDASVAANSRVRPIEARAALADQAPTLYRILADAGIRISDGTNWIPLRSSAVNDTNDETLNIHPRVRAAVTALDGSQAAGSQNRPLQCRALGDTGIVNTVQRLLSDASLRVIDNADATQYRALYGEVPDAISGRSTATIRGVYAAAILTKEDKTNSVLRTVETHRTDRQAVVNPAALQVLASLDTRGLCKVRGHVVFTAADTARIQVSSDNTNWITLEDIGGTPDSFFPTTAILLSQIEGWRYVRVLAVAGFTGTATVTLIAQGA